jgi:hypothetical protein
MPACGSGKACHMTFDFAFFPAHETLPTKKAPQGVEPKQLN